LLQRERKGATSGLSVAEVARRNHVLSPQIYIWRRQLLAKVKPMRVCMASCRDFR
jgi:hypothetical protein